MREGSIKNKALSGGIFTSSVNKFNNLVSYLEIDQDGRIPLTFANGKIVCGKGGCGDCLASSFKTSRKSNFFVANDQIRDSWRQLKFDSINEKKINKDLEAYKSMIEFCAQNIKKLIDILKKRFNEGYEYLKKEFSKVADYSDVESDFDSHRKNYNVTFNDFVLFYFGDVVSTMPMMCFCVAADAAYSTACATAFVTAGFSIIAIGLGLLAVMLIIKPIIDCRNSKIKQFGKEGIKIFKMISVEIDRNKKNLKNTLDKIKKFTVEFKKIGKNGDIFLEKAKNEAKKYLKTKKIGHNKALDTCKIEYFKIIKRFYVPKDEEELIEKENSVKNTEKALGKLISIT